jgi:hypothetical protein
MGETNSPSVAHVSYARATEGKSMHNYHVY